MTTQMMIRIDDEVKAKFGRLARLQGKTASGMIRELIEDYIRDRDIGAYIDDLWDRTGKKLTSKGVGPSVIDKAIKASRRSRG